MTRHGGVFPPATRGVRVPPDEPDAKALAALDRALKKHLTAKGYRQARYTTCAELRDFIRAEASPGEQSLITDLFETIGFYDDRVWTATASASRSETAWRRGPARQGRLGRIRFAARG